MWHTKQNKQTLKQLSLSGAIWHVLIEKSINSDNRGSTAKSSNGFWFTPHALISNALGEGEMAGHLKTGTYFALRYRYFIIIKI